MVSASREIQAPPERIFELIADPAQQPGWDGNGNLAQAPAGQRVRRAGEVFTMTLTKDGASAAAACPARASGTGRGVTPALARGSQGAQG